MDELQLNTKIPWYRTRKFWAIIFGLLFAWGIFFYFFIGAPGRSFGGIFYYLTSSLGGAIFGIIGNKIIPSDAGRMLDSLVYLLFAFFLTYKTFDKKAVQLFYPLLFTINFLVSAIVIILLLGAAG
ncbi:MAG: hypothetical protein WDZ88_03795 [Candidatus Paceibacterota bacterium]